jgi:hypothetical protein
LRWIVKKGPRGQLKKLSALSTASLTDAILRNFSTGRIKKLRKEIKTKEQKK